MLAVVSAPVGAQLVDVSNGPLYSGRQPHPNVVVSASVEFPTMGSAYLNVPYVRSNLFVGYFDSTKCYGYTTGNGGYFSVTASADPTTHECAAGTAFSGNFMNWLTMSAIDEFRYAITGGNRVNESGPNNGTIIQRAYLPDGSINGIPDFYARGENFPRHSIQGSTVDGYTASASTAVLPIPSGYGNTQIYVTNCRSQIYFGSQANGNCASPTNDYGQQIFGAAVNVRVLVCDDTEGPIRPDLCLQYGGSTGKYKPVGQAQQNAAKMRFAAFGYLMDRNVTNYTVPSGCDVGDGWNECRYGGVLRAPMKYVGPYTFDANQVQSPNTRQEIDANGLLVRDPEGTASSAGGTYSGFINYINKFGSVTDDPDASAGAGINGVYKRYDPQGEMFYEAIRYYQKLGPTPQAISGSLNNAVKGNFPITTTWTDPIASICASNYIINLADTNTNDDTYLPGYNGSPNAGRGRPSSRAVEGGLDAYLWTGRIGTLESTTKSITANDVRPGLSNVANGNPSNNSSYLSAGAAFWANNNDIRSDLTGKQTIKTISVDVAEAAGDIHDRQLYLMGKYGGFDNTIDRATDTYANPFWATDPSNSTGPAVRSNSEWEDSVGSAYPSDYLLASNPQKLIDGLRAAFGQIAGATGTTSGAALTSVNLTTGPAGAYVANFNAARWSGSVLLKLLSTDTSGNLIVSNAWDAGQLLTVRCGSPLSGTTTCADTDTTVNKRNIVTTIQSGGLRVARNFTWANVSTDSTYAAVLNTNPATGATDSRGQQRLNYLRGYRADEASSIAFRQRDSAMGDVINSAPVYVGAPTTGIADADYQAFYATNATRTQAVYVGANDGMLHAFNAAANSGAELFAYVPGFATDDLNDLTNPGYSHETFVDAVPTVQEVKSNGTWKTALVSGVGAGAQGVFALDVTNPAGFGPANVIFEFSDKDDADFGNVLTSPTIVKLQTGVSAGVPVYGWFAIVTGYNNRRTTINGRTDSRVSSDTNNRGVLYILSLDRTLGTPWVLGTNYYKYFFPASNSAVANGLGPVSASSNSDGSGSTAALYFGDLQGSLWRFNTVGTSPSAWVPSRGTVAAPLPMFIATTAGGVKQPITARPTIAPGPYGSTLVFFGTGEYIGQSDLSTPYAQQSEYALIDDGSGTLINRGSDLQPRTATLSGSSITITGTAFAYSGSGSKKGWVLDFPGSTTLGERSITKPAVTNGAVAFTTLTLSSDVCASGGGNIYQVNALTGLPYPSAAGGQVSTIGIPGPPIIVALTNTPGQLRPTGEQINTGTQSVVVAGTTGISSAQAVTLKVPPVGRINWRELTNWNDRH